MLDHPGLMPDCLAVARETLEREIRDGAVRGEIRIRLRVRRCRECAMYFHVAADIHVDVYVQVPLEAQKIEQHLTRRSLVYDFATGRIMTEGDTGEPELKVYHPGQSSATFSVELNGPPESEGGDDEQ